MFWAARALHWWSQRVYNLVRKDQEDHPFFFLLLLSGGRGRGDGPSSRGNLVKLHRAGDRSLQLLIFNEEFLVSASHQLALITSLPFVSLGWSFVVQGADCREGKPKNTIFCVFGNTVKLRETLFFLIMNNEQIKKKTTKPKKEKKGNFFFFL